MMIKKTLSLSLLFALFQFKAVATKTVTILVDNNYYNPGSVTVSPGDTIKFQWVAGNHPTSSDDETSISLFSIDENNREKKFVFSSEQVIPYYCHLHGGKDGQGMSGTIEVKASAPLSELLFLEDFEYDYGSLLTSNGWTAHSGAGSKPITVSDYSLFYDNSPSSGKGKAVALKRTGEDVHHTFTSIDADSLYASFFVRVDSVKSGDYFFHLGPNPFSTPHRVRVYIKKNELGFQFGISKESSVPPEYATTIYDLGKTYFVVVKYLFVNTTANDDQVFLFINPILGEQEPVPDISITAGGGSDAGNLGSVALRQGSESTSPILTLDGIHIGRSFSSVTPLVLDPVVSFAKQSESVTEKEEKVEVLINIANPSTVTSTTVDIAIKGGTASDSSDFAFTSPQTITFAANSTESQSITITIYNDSLPEANETITLVLRNTTNGAVLSPDSIFTLTIQNDDLPGYDIEQVRGMNDYGVADSANVKCRLTGTVYGKNLHPERLLFTIRDKTAGIAVFSDHDNRGYTVREGNRVSVYGRISQQNGLTCIEPDSIRLITENDSLKTAQEIISLSEETESDLVVFRYAHLVDTSQWNPSGSGFTVQITNDKDTIDVRIDADVDLFNNSAPHGYFHITGIGWQFDADSPYHSGYQLMPENTADIEKINPAVYFENDSTDYFYQEYEGDISTPVYRKYPDNTETTIDILIHPYSTAKEGEDFKLLSKKITFAPFATTATILLHLIDDEMEESPEAIVLQVANATGNAIIDTTNGNDQLTILIFSDDKTGVKTTMQHSFIVYPNPSGTFIYIKSELNPEEISITDIYGNGLLKKNVSGQQPLIDISSLPGGNYLLEVMTDEGKSVRMITVQ